MPGAGTQASMWGAGGVGAGSCPQQPHHTPIITQALNPQGLRGSGMARGLRVWSHSASHRMPPSEDTVSPNTSYSAVTMGKEVSSSQLAGPQPRPDPHSVPTLS